MIQDLCLALKGVPGLIFTFDDNRNFRKFSRKEPSIIFVGGEIDILNNILELGSLRAKIYEYTSTSKGSFHSYDDIAKSALEHSIQNTYEKFIDEIEEDFVKGGPVSFGTLFAKCGKWKNVLETCVQMISEMEEKKKSGTGIIDIFESWFILKASVSEELKEIIQSILFVLEGRFLEDLISWYREGSIAEGFFLEENEESRNAFIPSADLVFNRVPNCVSARSADCILTAGNWRKVIKQHEIAMRLEKEDGDDDAYTTRKLDADIFELCEDLMVGEGHLNWDLSAVRMERLDWNRLGEITRKVLKLISSFLWNICEQESTLTKHFEAMRNVYMMNRGDLFTCFSDYLAEQTDAVSPYRRAWNLSCWNAGLDAYEDLFTVKVLKKQISPLENGASPYPLGTKSQLAKLYISPVIDPRLNFLFTESQTHKCNLIYQFHGRLCVIFSSMGLNSSTDPKFFIIMRWVSGMVCHQALKLQTNWKNFKMSLEVKDLEAIMQSYEKMLHNCLRDCFFLDLELHNSFNSILEGLETEKFIEDIIERISNFKKLLKEKEQSALLMFLE